MTTTSPDETDLADEAPPDRPDLGRVVAWVLLVGGLLGTLAAFGLTVESIALATDPNYVPSCNVNPLISCGSVMTTPQGAVLGFPNSLLGLAAFPVAATLGAVLLTGARLPRWYWLGLQVGLLVGVVFVHWLIFQSLYRIGALCPYCMVIWAVTIPMFWYTTLQNLARGHLPVPSTWTPAVDLAVRQHVTGVVVWFLAIVLFIFQAFFDAWMALLA